MTLKDFKSKKISSNQLESSSNNKEKTKEQSINRSNKTLKQMRTSLFNRIHFRRSTENVENKIKHEEEKEQQEELEQQEQKVSPIKRPSIIKSTDIPRSLSKKSVAFASTIDQENIEHDEEDFNFNREINTNDETSSETDIVTVIANKRVDEKIMMNSNKNEEPYPFRSEIQLSTALQAHLETNRHHSPNKIIHRLMHHCHRKKAFHPLSTVTSVGAMNRSNSTPNIMISSLPSAVNSMEKIKTNNRRRPLKTFRTWFKSLPLPHFLRSNHKYTQEKNMSKTMNCPIPRQSIGLRRLSELLF